MLVLLFGSTKYLGLIFLKNQVEPTSPIIHMCICRTKEARKCSRPFGYLKIQIHEEIAQFWFLLICLIFRIKIELHFSLIAAAVLYIMWKNVGQEKIHRIEGKSIKDDPNPMDSKKRRGTEKFIPMSLSILNAFW